MHALYFIFKQDNNSPSIDFVSLFQIKIMLKNYLSLIKFSHTIFALPFALIGFTLAEIQLEYAFSWNKILFVLLCMIFARSAAMAFNRYIDRDIDTVNPRTSEIREIPRGIITANATLIFVIINCILFVGCSYMLNSLCLYLSQQLT